MTISTSNRYQASLDSLVIRQSEMSRTQLQLTSGKRVNVSSDDPAAASRAERSLASERRSVSSQRGVDASNNAMSLAEAALGNANDLMQNVREALVGAGNPIQTDAQRLTIANQIAGWRQELLTIANRSDGAGSYLFGGQGANQPPFVDAIGGVQYAGAAGSSIAASGEALPLTIDGATTFMQARTGNGVFETRPTTSTGSAWIDTGSVTNPSLYNGSSTYAIQFGVTAGVATYSVLKDGAATAQTNVAFKPDAAVSVDGLTATIHGTPANGDVFTFAPSTSTLSVFDVLDKAIADLKIANRSGSQVAQTNSSNLAAVDAVLGQTFGTRSEIGATLNRVDNVTGRLSASKLASQTARSDAEDLDMTQAIADFQNRQTGYDAALRAYSMVQRLSLFNYLNG
jgi:flagellar hook-associated protein 3 FlgL